MGLVPGMRSKDALAALARNRTESISAVLPEMMCPKCGKEMRKGYLFSSKDGAFSFANEVPGALENAKNAEGFVKLTGLKVGGRTSVETCRCDVCRMILISYGEEAAKI